MDRYDVAVIGCGQAAMPLIPKLVHAGLRVVLFERAHLGGSCVNFGCTPTKAALAPAHLAAATRHGTLGALVSDAHADFDAVMDRARAIRDQANGNVRRKFSKLADEHPDRFTLVPAHARLAGKHDGLFELTAGDETLLADRVVLETGTRTLRPPIDGLDGLPPHRLMTAGDWIERRGHPGRLVMVGGGYIGLEGSQLYLTTSAGKPNMTAVVEKGQQVAKNEDPDVADALRRQLESDGVSFHLGRKVTAVREQGDALTVTLEDKNGGSETIEADTLYLTPGRRPNTDDVGLETVGLEPSSTLEVDDLYETRVEKLHAVGDITGGKMFTHSAQWANKVLADLLTGEKKMRRPSEHMVPYAMFTDPPLGRAGFTERAAREAGYDVAAVTFEAANSDRHHQSGREAGLIKLVGDRASGRLLGAACLCEAGPELAIQAQLCLAAGGDLDLITKTMFIHPTFSEALLSAAHKLQRELTG